MMMIMMIMIITITVEQAAGAVEACLSRTGELLGGTTCLALLASYGLICFLRHYVSNAANLICCIICHF